MLSARATVPIVLAIFTAAVATRGTAQRPLAPIATSGQTAYPVFEGWYKNADGSFSISFGYFNRNDKEDLDIPIGANNFLAPGAQNQGQPTHFEPRRHWGVFAVRVPADFGTKSITWTLTVRGETFAIPGSLRAEWQIDALEGEVGSGNTPPVLRFAEGGPEARGPGGYTAGPLSTSVHDSLLVTVWAQDDGRSPAILAAAAAPPATSTATPPATGGAAGAAGGAATGAARGAGGRGRGGGPMTTLTWFLHQGPADVTFTRPTAGVPVAGGSASTYVKFQEPGEYLLRVRANDASGIAGAGHAQCCWTNGFVRVIVK